jgi:HSP20 family protein
MIMMNITRRDPVQELTIAEPFRNLERLLGWPRLPSWFKELPAEPTIKLDVTEDEKAYFVKAELPGVKKEDIEVEVNGNQVSLAAEVKREKIEKKGETLVHSERYYGRQYRSFSLAQPVDRKKAVAKFTDGVLELTLPKDGIGKKDTLAIQ